MKPGTGSTAEHLPIICGHCKEPLKLRRQDGRRVMLERETGERHFLSGTCAVAYALERVRLSDVAT